MRQHIPSFRIAVWALALCSQAWAAAAPAEPAASAAAARLDRWIQADFILPAYVNLERATLVVVGAKELPRPLEVRVEFAQRNSGRAPCEARRIRVLPGQRETLVIDIAAWADGDYRTTLDAPASGRPPLVRWLRKQTQPDWPAPRGPLAVGGSSTLFVDDWYVQRRPGLVPRRHVAETFGIVTKLLAPDSRQIFPVGGIDLRPDGSIQVGVRDADTDGKTRYYTARSANGLEWVVTSNVPNQPTPYTPPPSPHWRPRPTPVAKAAPTKAGQFRFYDARRDGPVVLDQIEMLFTGAAGQNKNRWGALSMPLRSTYPVWQKPDGEALILLERPLTADNHMQPDGNPGDWQDTNDNWIRPPWRSPDGRTLYYGHSRMILRYDPFRTPYDNQKHLQIGSYNRILVRWETSDGLHWTPAFLDPQREDDPVGHQGYGGSQFYAENGRLSLCMLYRYNARSQQMWPELLYSRDNRTWKRLADHGPIAPNGPWGSWNFGRMLGWHGNAVERDGWIYQLFGNCDSRPHFYSSFIGHRRPYVTAQFLRDRFTGTDLPSWPYWHLLGSWEGLAADARTHCRAIGGMRYRKHGWVSLRPDGPRGELTTRVLAAGSALSLNARTESGGSLRVEVLDESGQPLAAYSGQNAALFTGDSTDAPLAWQGGTLRQLPARPLRLRIAVERAELFALNWK